MNSEHEAYLERSGVVREVEEVLKQLVTKQPPYPLAYLARHFEQLVRPPRQPLAEAVELIQETSPSNTTLLEGAVYGAFSLLTETEDKAKVLSAGVHSSLYNRLLRELCCSLDPHTADSFLKQLQLPEDGTVFYQAFHSGVAAWLSLRELLKTAEELFLLLDENHRGTIERRQGEAILAQLSASLCTVSELNITLSIQQVKRLLQPSELARTLTQGNREDSLLPARQLPLEEFKRLTAELFLKHHKQDK